MLFLKDACAVLPKVSEKCLIFMRFFYSSSESQISPSPAFPLPSPYTNEPLPKVQLKRTCTTIRKSSSSSFVYLFIYFKEVKLTPPRPQNIFLTSLIIAKDKPLIRFYLQNTWFFFIYLFTCLYMINEGVLQLAFHFICTDVSL